MKYSARRGEHRIRTMQKEKESTNKKKQRVDLDFEQRYTVRKETAAAPPPRLSKGHFTSTNTKRNEPR